MGILKAVIIVLIFVVIASSVLLYWLNSLFPPINRYDPLGQEKENQLLADRLMENENIIATSIPEITKISPNSEVRFKIGLKKCEELSDYNYFGICIGNVDSVGCTTASSEPVRVAGDDSGINFMFPATTKIEEINHVSILSALSEIPFGVSGIHTYRLYVCPLSASNEKCTVEKSYDYADFSFTVG
jgi:hypothetical protein